MPRNLSEKTLENLSAGVVKPFFAVEMLFDGDEVLRLTTDDSEIIYQGNSWYGLGTLINISSIEETSDISVKGATITLSGVPSEVLSLALSEPYQGRVCNIYFGTFSGSDYLADESGNRLVTESGQNIVIVDADSEEIFEEIFSGYMDQMNITESGSETTIELLVENKLIDLERARVARFSSGYQKSLYPNDKGLDFVEDLQDKDILWGRKIESSS